MSILSLDLDCSRASFALYIGIAWCAKAKTTGDFYVAERADPAGLNGMATGADWMSAASFISMAGLIAFLGRDGSMYLMGWTGGYVLLAMLLAPTCASTVNLPCRMFVGDRYYSNGARVVAVICADLRFLHLCGRPDARRRASSSPASGSLHQHGRAHRYGASSSSSRPGRHEGDHLYPGGPVCGADLRLPDPGHLHLHAAHRQPDPAAGHGSTITAKAP